MESITRCPSTAATGTVAGRDPVATMAWRNSRKTVVPSVFWTATRPRPVKRATPEMMSTPARCSDPVTPLTSPPTTAALWSCQADRSSTSTSAPPIRRTIICASAASMSVLDGMQPTLRQTPPMPSRSTRVTRRPSCAARSAAG